MAKVKTLRGVNKTVIPYFLKFGINNYHVNYDQDADVLYISFRKPQCADDSVMDGDFIYHYDGKTLVGMTILNAHTKSKS